MSASAVGEQHQIISNAYNRKQIINFKESILPTYFVRKLHQIESFVPQLFANTDKIDMPFYAYDVTAGDNQLKFFGLNTNKTFGQLKSTIERGTLKK